MSEEKENVIAKALIRIIENQITLKTHLGIIKYRSRYADDEYDADRDIIDELIKHTK